MNFLLSILYIHILISLCSGVSLNVISLQNFFLWSWSKIQQTILVCYIFGASEQPVSLFTLFSESFKALDWDQEAKLGDNAGTAQRCVLPISFLVDLLL